MTTRSGTPYHAQTQSSAPIDQNFEALMKTLSDQMARLNQDLVGQLAQTNQSMADHMTHITLRLDRLEVGTLARTLDARIEPEFEPELGTPINPRRALH